MNLGTDLFGGQTKDQEQGWGRPRHSLETLSAVLGDSGVGEQGKKHAISPESTFIEHLLWAQS